ncbi:MAG: hypothetical protein NT094_04100 [Candidatus Staskawiczbacteria bacterium]|nr:hypothetical protein [Candidatus Staskawiczbacteria bacterium]
MAYCSLAKKALGGGATINNTNLYLADSFPVGSSNSGWIVWYHNPTNINQTATIKVKAICASFN